MQEASELNGKVLLITHGGGCRDGLGCVMSMTKFANENPNIELEIHLAVYDDAPMPCVTGKHVVMADFSYDRTTIIDIHDEAKSLVVLDHHKSAKANLEGLDYCLFDMDKSGAMLMWEYLYPTIEAPSIIKYIQDRDLWNWDLAYSKEINAAFAVSTPVEVMNNLDYYMSGKCIKPLFVKGEPIILYQDAKVLEIIGDPYKLPTVSVGGYVVPCINNEHLTSEVGNALTEYFPLSLQYFITKDNRFKFSFRSSRTSPHGFVDVSVLAKSLGGGGHEVAAGFGFSVEEFDYNNFFINKMLIQL